ncbi:MAG: OBAP family protein [Planctomycetota bacterium]
MTFLHSLQQRIPGFRREPNLRQRLRRSGRAALRRVQAVGRRQTTRRAELNTPTIVGGAIAVSILAMAGLYFWRRAYTRTTVPGRPLPGRAKRTGIRALEAGAALFQGRWPLSAINLYLDGFHFYADDMGHQVEAHHYCAQLNEDVAQCVIYDGNTPAAHLIGVEYIISERLFRQLPEDEKKLWHSHRYEVTGGLTIAPGLPRAAEHQLMQTIGTTYGKIWHTWDSTHDVLPLGIPKLMMAFTAPGQLNPELARDRDDRFGISSAALRKHRADLHYPPVTDGADAWQHGEVPQLDLVGRRVGVPGIVPRA